MSERESNDVVCLTTAATPAQAHIIEQALQAEGVECKVVGDFLDAGLGDISGLLAEVWVHREDLESAQQIINRSRPAD